MDEAPIVDAVERIEAALSRLEIAAQGLKARATGSPSLQQRHETLKATVAGSLAQLDALLASRGR